MQELRLVGADDEHLRLAGEQGGSYSLPIDEALRKATRREVSDPIGDEHPPPAPVPRTVRQTVPMTPRDIQARIRSGSTAEQIATESGLDLKHVQRYEGPVRAERDYVAYLARRVEVASPLPTHDGYRSAFGDEPAQLGDMVAYRARSYDVDVAALDWDSWRLPDGSWQVVALFDLPEGSRVDLGEQPPARWTYNPTRKTVTNGNRWAQVLSELEPLDGPLPSRRLSAVADRVFDFEAGSESADGPGPGDAEVHAEDQDSLLQVLRSRRGQRLGVDEDGDDALAVLLTRGAIPAAHPRTGFAADGDDVDGHSAHGEDSSADDPASETDAEPILPGLSLIPERSGNSRGDSDGSADHHDDGTPRLYDGVSTDTREIRVFAQPTKDDVDAASTGDTARSTPDQAAADRRTKPKRSSVPSWDDIVFGRRSD